MRYKTRIQVTVYIDESQKPVFQSAKAQALLHGQSFGDYVVEALKAKIKAETKRCRTTSKEAQK